MYQLRTLPVKEHIMKAILRACQKLYSWSDVGCKPNENVTRASMCCKYSSGVLLRSKSSKCLIGSAIDVEDFMYVVG